MYNYIFVSNLRSALEDRQLSRSRLSELSGISPSFLFELLSGKANPSLKVMEAIAEALEIPLEMLLSSASIDRRELERRAGRNAAWTMPNGYESVFAVIPQHQAFMVRKWAKRSLQRLNHPADRTITSQSRHAAGRFSA